MDAPEQRVSLRVSPLAYFAGIVAGVLLLGILGVLIAVLSVLEDSREHIQAQDHKIAQIQHQTDPLIAGAKPAVEQAEPLLRRVRRLLGPAGDSLDSLTAATDTVPRLAMGAQVVLNEAIPLVERLNAFDAPGAIATIARLADSLQENDRTVQALDVTTRVLEQVQNENLIPRTSKAIPRFEELLITLAQVQKRTLSTQKLSLRTQRRQANLTFESIRIQRELLEHTRSIDAKIPPLTPQTAAPATPGAP